MLTERQNDDGSQQRSYCRTSIATHLEDGLCQTLLAAIIILPFGQHAISWFALAALLAAIIMVRLGVWYVPA